MPLLTVKQNKFEGLFLSLNKKKTKLMFRKLEAS